MFLEGTMDFIIIIIIIIIINFIAHLKKHHFTYQDDHQD